MEIIPEMEITAITELIPVMIIIPMQEITVP